MQVKSLLLFVGIFLSLQSWGQKKIVWFDAGAKVQYGASGFYNAALANNSDYNYRIGTGYGYGGKLGINFGFNGLSIDVMRNTGSQLLERKVNGTFSGNNETIDWSSWDVYALFRNAKNLGYFEIGPKISFLNSVEHTGVDGDTQPISENDFNSNVVSGVLGFGVNFIGNDGAFSGILGLRFEYGLTDLITDSGKINGAPLRNPAVYTNTDKSTNSHVAFAGLVFELNWGIGYFAKTRCGARSKFIRF
jgi:hypothetical protein